MSGNAWEQATVDLLAAIDAEDPAAVAQALEIRAGLMAAGLPPTPRAFELGREACSKLDALKQKLAAEAARLQQLRAYL